MWYGKLTFGLLRGYNGFCEFDVVETVECCISEDCPSGFFCDAEKTCKESIVSKTDCTFECCVGEDKYFERPCSSEEFCVDNICKAEEEEQECGAWVEIAGQTIVPDLFCVINQWTLKFRIWFAAILGLLGGLLGISYLLRFLPQNSETKTKVIVSIITFLLVGIAIFVLALIFFWWILLFLVILGVVRLLLPGV